jgi:primosomal protein N' (replication factor Y) (superfamily II helicase)
MFVTVAVNIPTEKTFSYSVPESLQQKIAIGKRVLVPFGKRRLTGYIIEVSSFASCEETKDIIEVLDPESLFNEEDLRFYRWASQYYIYPLGKALSEILPGGINPKTVRWICSAKERTERHHLRLPLAQLNIIDAIDHSPGGLPFDRLKKLLRKKDLYRDINALVGAGFIAIEERNAKPEIIPKTEKLVHLNHKHSAITKLTRKQILLTELLRSHGHCSVNDLRKKFKNVLPLLRSLEGLGIIRITEEEVSRRHGQQPDMGGDIFITPNEDQEHALRVIGEGLKSNSFSPFLLHGVTGSGKTEVYLNAIAETLKMNGGVIILIPEIALTPQLLSRFNRRFPDQEIAVLHSGISRTARYDQWRRIQRGEISVVMGARSAVFAPVRNLKLIIVDEEHDSSYKQDDRMRYNARDLAIMKASLNSATVILGSATPAVQTFFNTMNGKYKYLILPSRVEDRPLPEVKIIDMKPEKEDRRGSSPQILSKTLKEAIGDTLARKEQALLFLNRRGSHHFTFCFDCGHVFKCVNCAVSMTYHASESNLKCHYCDHVMKPSSTCPACRGKRIRSYGLGTEKLEEEVKNLFPHARIDRMDSDTTARKGAHEKILKALDRRDIDILVGTQMITKGHDFPYITLVGVISADTSMNIPDFRAAERTFQLLTQVSGRGGRGASPGRVIIQTFNPGHYAIIRAKDHDYIGFYDTELALRRALLYPPFTRIVNIQVSSLSRDRAVEGLKGLQQLIHDSLTINKLKDKVEVIGPAESPIPKIKGRHRWQILLKGKNVSAVHDLAKDILSKAYVTGLDIKVDVDPLNFM